MNKLSAGIFFISFLMFTSCGEDEGNDPASLSGSYKIIKLVLSNCDDPDLNTNLDFSDNDCVTELGIEFCLDGTLTLSDNGTLTASFTLSALGFSDSTTESGTYTVDGNSITFCDSSNDCEKGTIRDNGDEITISFPPDEDDCVLTITAEKV